VLEGIFYRGNVGGKPEHLHVFASMLACSERKNRRETGREGGRGGEG